MREGEATPNGQKPRPPGRSHARLAEATPTGPPVPAGQQQLFLEASEHQQPVSSGVLGAEAGASLQTGAFAFPTGGPDSCRGAGRSSARSKREEHHTKSAALSRAQRRCSLPTCMVAFRHLRRFLSTRRIFECHTCSSALLIGGLTLSPCVCSVSYCILLRFLPACIVSPLSLRVLVFSQCTNRSQQH